MSINDTLKERGKTHGDFRENSRLSQAFKNVIRTGVNYPELTDVQLEALHMIVHKISRILSGNQNHADAWHDIAGYATLVEEQLSTGTNEENTVE